MMMNRRGERGNNHPSLRMARALALQRELEGVGGRNSNAGLMRGPHPG